MENFKRKIQGVPHIQKRQQKRKHTQNKNSYKCLRNEKSALSSPNGAIRPLENTLQQYTAS